MQSLPPPSCWKTERRVFLLSFSTIGSTCRYFASYMLEEVALHTPSWLKRGQYPTEVGVCRSRCMVSGPGIVGRHLLQYAACAAAALVHSVPKIQKLFKNSKLPKICTLGPKVKNSSKMTNFSLFLKFEVFEHFLNFWPTVRRDATLHSSQPSTPCWKNFGSCLTGC